MYQVRDDEPEYAFIPDVAAPASNQWGKNVTLVNTDDALAGKSMHINGDGSVGSSPHRYRQHGFHFTADNCIGCHACEAACSEKNELPAHISFRSVGYLEGGSYPAYRRMNISMACNHCDDPVCLKGCPTRAYTKFAEYGAVLQDPDICFGCGYCTWVCPYNAPQLDPVKGQVSKCNMCVDRLEVGLKPACAAACLGGALDFGVIETTPENREQAKIHIPGFPDPEITHPNIRFQQIKSLPRDMTRTDSTPIRYQRDAQGVEEYKAKSHGAPLPKQWNLLKLSSRENPLVLFTLVTQTVVGAFILLFLGPMFGLEMLGRDTHPYIHAGLLVALIGAQTLALAVSTLHLGKPHRFYRAFNNLKYSPVSREVAGIAVFYNLLVIYSLASVFPTALNWISPTLTHAVLMVCGWGAVIAGPVAIHAMHKIYRIKARPFWNHWQVLTSFYGTMLSLGSLIVGWVFAAMLTLSGEGYGSLLSVLTLPITLGLIVDGIGLIAHGKYLSAYGAEASAAQWQQLTVFGHTHGLRNKLLVLACLLAPGFGLWGMTGGIGLLAWSLLALGCITAAVIGRALFYVLVVPTTMPGAFFWRNQGFEAHARASGLARMEQVGVLPQAEYHDLQKQRVVTDLKNEYYKLRQRGLSYAIRQGWRLVFTRA